MYVTNFKQALTIPFCQNGKRLLGLILNLLNPWSISFDANVFIFLDLREQNATDPNPSKESLTTLSRCATKVKFHPYQ